MGVSSLVRNCPKFLVVEVSQQNLFYIRKCFIYRAHLQDFQTCTCGYTFGLMIAHTAKVLKFKKGLHIDLQALFICAVYSVLWSGSDHFPPFERRGIACLFNFSLYLICYSYIQRTLCDRRSCRQFGRKRAKNRNLSANCCHETL